MEAVLEPTNLLLSLAGFIAGFLDAVAGGGGLILMPSLLASGMPPHLVLGTNKLAGTFGTATASLAYIRRGLFRPRQWLGLGLATFAGALTGTLAAYATDEEHLSRILPVAILLATLYMLSGGRRRPEPSAPGASAGQRPWLGVLIGGYDGYIGPGTGAFWTSVALRILGLDLVKASGLARFMNLISNATALAAFMALGSVDYATGLLMGITLMLGAYLGARSAIRLGARLIKPLLLLVVVSLCLKQILQTWG